MKRLFLFFVLLILFGAAIRLFMTWKQEMTLQLSHAAPVLVDVSEDDSALGFPDSRKLAIDSNGHLYVAYRKRYKLLKTTRYHIFVAKSTDEGATWQVSNGGQPVEDVGDFVQRVPSIAVDSHDVVHVVWYGTDATFSGDNERQVKYVRSADGGASWSAWRNIAPVEGYADAALWQEHPTISLAQPGHLYVVWQGRDAHYGPKSQIKYVHSADGGASWSTWRNMSPDPERSFSRPVLLATLEGALYALAYADGQDVMQIFWTYSADGGLSWAAWAAVAPGQQDQRHLTAAVDPKGRIHLAWRQIPEQAAPSASPQIYYALYSGRAWRAPSPITQASAASNETASSETASNETASGATITRDQLYQFFPTLTIDLQGRPWVAWIETTDPSNYPREKPTTGAIRYTAASWNGWRAPATLAADASFFPSFMYVNPHQLPAPTPALVWLKRLGDEESQILFTSLLLD